VIYIDTSVVLAELFSETRRPPAIFWSERKISSRLLEYEIIVRLHARGEPASVLQLGRDILNRTELVDLDEAALERVLQPFPVNLRTLDAIHLSTMIFLQRRGITLELATYDARLGHAAAALGFALAVV
jgi:predicted nucleic acid-binding protein